MLKRDQFLMVMGVLVGALGTAPTLHARDLDPQHMAACVAVLKKEVNALLPDYEKSPAATRARIQQLTEEGFAFIGTAYQQGLRQGKADQLLNEAEQKLSQESPEKLQKLSLECQKEGATLLAQASFWERGLVVNRARKRVDRLLSK